MKSIIQKKKECYVDIPGYEHYYQINRYGDIISLRFVNGTINTMRDTPLILKPQIRNNYKVVNLSKNGVRKQESVHRLVAKTFIKNPNNYEIVNHKDYNTLNNNVENLEWCTQKQNIQYSIINMKGKRHIKNRETYGIFYRKKINKYELTLNKKYLGHYKTLEEAKKVRDEVLANETILNIK